jgi:cyanosortase A-associated protein
MILAIAFSIVMVLTGLPIFWRKSTSSSPLFFSSKELPVSPQLKLISNAEIPLKLKTTVGKNWMGRRYQYHWQPSQQGQMSAQNLEVTDRELVTVEIFLSRVEPTGPVDGPQLLPQLMQTEEQNSQIPFQIQFKIQYDPQMGHFAEFVYHDRAYISACLPPERETIFTASQHAYSQRLAAKNLRQIAFWVIGFNDLRDWRCVWINVSLEPRSQDATATFNQLKQFWQLLMKR